MIELTVPFVLSKHNVQQLPKHTKESKLVTKRNKQNVLNVKRQNKELVKPRKIVWRKRKLTKQRERTRAVERGTGDLLSISNKRNLKF